MASDQTTKINNTNLNRPKTRKGLGANTHKMIQIAMLGAIAAVLMIFEFPMPFLAPGFYEFDFSEIPVLIGGFAMGPFAGVLIELVKILVHLLIKGTNTAFVGELGNFLIGCSLIVPASIIYKIMKNKKGALIGLITGTACLTVIGPVLNAFLLLPFYAKAYGMPIQAFVDMGTLINPAVDSVFKFCLLLVAPFNLVKGIIISVITMLIYKRISTLLKSFWTK